MKLLLERKYLTGTYTIGSLFVDGEYFSDTIEDKVRDLNKDGDLDDPGETKVDSQTAIPYGTYKVLLTMSPKFTRLLPLVLDVPGFTGIRIHRGNTAEDSSGCILVGENKEKGKVINSTDHEMRLVEKIFDASVKGETIELQII